jgi:hypothetical protein
MEIETTAIEVLRCESFQLSGGPKMTSTIKVEIASVCAAFAFVATILAVVW